MRIALILLSALFAGSLFSQGVKAGEKDLALRQAMAAKYLKENSYDYKTGEAKATHAILMEAFSKNSVVVPVNTDNIANTEDKANVISLIGGLNSILVLTPSWQELVSLEKQKVLFEDKAMHRTPLLMENQNQQK